MTPSRSSGSSTDVNITRKFVSILHDWKPSGTELSAAARLFLIDGLSVAFAGAREPGPRFAGELALQQCSSPLATVIGQGFSTSLSQATQINGMSMHVLDYEPMWNPPNHALSTILPGLLALAEFRESQGAGPQGAPLMCALLKGIEAQGRLRLSSGQIEPRELSLHPPGVVGPLASAIACGEFLGLDENQRVAAVGIAASRACGILANVGSMTKALHCGDASRSGLEAALLAEKGFTADPDALAGPRGYGQAYFGDRFDVSHLLAPLSVPRALNPGPAWKLFPSQYATHFVITAALDCWSRIADPSRIKSVQIVTPVMPYIDRPTPNSGLDGKFSLQYCTIVALLDGRVTLPSFTDARRYSADAVNLLANTHLTQTSDISGRFDAMHVDVAVTLDDGTQVAQRCAAPLGSWSRPITPKDIENKSHDLLDLKMSSEDRQTFWQMFAEPAERIQISTLLRCLAK
ncbi:MmgE/PrpD family protein [Zwartia sp.]|uniref:MmgE/PrpD family protein n=1 Tax=Zwartia sp. TaxID=2978004 RepID=UPI002723CFBB|nr:MmgE/PrpD family protein [Zwartia sp.]MDO9024119.1 MmgE/PrpD family protein [Zwartia sp.]